MLYIYIPHTYATTGATVDSKQRYSMTIRKQATLRKQVTILYDRLLEVNQLVPKTGTEFKGRDSKTFIC